MTSRVEDHPSEVVIGDLTHLPLTPGDVDAPGLVLVTKLTDTSVELVTDNVQPGHRVQYRYWSYNGLRDLTPGVPFQSSPESSPSEFRVPYSDLAGGFNISGVRGIISFQVRSLDPDDNPSGNSNILHEMIGMAGFHTIGPGRSTLAFDVALPTPPPYGTPLPTPEQGSRPARPSISDVDQVGGIPNLVEAQLGASYSDSVEYRWWPHNGFGPTDEFEDWLPATATLGAFRIADVKPDVSEVSGIPSGVLFDFQVRLVNAEDIPGDPSDVVALLVWSGDYVNWVPTPVFGPSLNISAHGTPLPPPEQGSRPTSPVIDEVVQIETLLSTVEVRLAASYSDDVEYRWWPHSGFGPTEEFEDWIAVSVAGQSFLISDVKLGVTEMGGIPTGMLFDFQVRLVNAAGIPSDPSDVEALLVWGGDYADWLRNPFP